VCHRYECGATRKATCRKKTGSRLDHHHQRKSLQMQTTKCGQGNHSLLEPNFRNRCRNPTFSFSFSFSFGLSSTTFCLRENDSKRLKAGGEGVFVGGDEPLARWAGGTGSIIAIDFVEAACWAAPLGTAACPKLPLGASTLGSPGETETECIAEPVRVCVVLDRDPDARCGF